MLIVHHLGKSQSERIVWLCEELEIPYDLKRYDRDSHTMLAPPEYKALHPLGAAPVINDEGLVLAESAAIMEYVIGRHGSGRFAVTPDEPNYADYLYWFHFVNGTLQPAVARTAMLNRAGVAPGSAINLAVADRLHVALSVTDTRLGLTPYLAGEALTASDMMNVFTLSTMRYFAPFDLEPYPNILKYLQRVSRRAGYRAAMEKGDPGMALLLS
jgi:glutathione S-transferase